MYKSCPDLSQLTGTTAPIVNPDTEYRAAYKQSTNDPEHFNANNSTLADNAAASCSDDDDGINEVCLIVNIFVHYYCDCLWYWHQRAAPELLDPALGWPLAQQERWRPW